MKGKLRRFWRSIWRIPVPRDESSAEKFSRYSFLMHFHPAWIKSEHLKLKHSFCLGGVTALLFLVTVVSGIVLLFYYHPSPELAHDSVQDIDNVVWLGSWWRTVHRFASELMIITTVLHMLRVVIHKAYAPPREFNWMVGVLLLLLVLFTAFTGYLLPYDVLSYDAVSVAKGMAEEAPFVGKMIVKLLFGGDRIGAETILRFYVLHCFVLPALLILFMGMHFWRVRKDGFKGGL